MIPGAAIVDRADGGDGAGASQINGGAGRSNERGGANGGGGGGGSGCVVIRTSEAQIGDGFRVNPRVDDVMERLTLE